MRYRVRRVGRRAAPRVTTAIAAALLTAAGAAVAGCGDDPVSPTEAIAGSYQATEWIITTDSESWDLLEGGGHLRVTLRSDGTTEGELFIPAGVAPAPGRQSPDGPMDERVALAGTWTLEGDVVQFDHPTDTYLKFVDWEVVRPGELFNVHVNGPYTFKSRLER